MNESKPKPDLLAQPKHEQIVAVLAWVSVDQQWTMSRQSQLLRLQHLMKAQPGMIHCHVELFELQNQTLIELSWLECHVRS